MPVRPPAGARPTLEDVAAHAGVSRATASRVLNSSPRTSHKAREAVERAVRELGYSPNAAARSLATRRTDAVALVISEPEAFIFDDPFFATVIRAASHELSSAGSQMLLLMVHQPDDIGRIARFLNSGHVDGALLFTPHKSDPLPRAVHAMSLPAVFSGRPWSSSSGLHSVTADNAAGAALATQHLLARGRIRITTITGPLDQPSAVDRLDGWRSALGADETTTHLMSEDGGFTAEGGERAMAVLLKRVPDLDAVFAASDLMASGALRALHAAGKRVPGDVAIVGFDDHPVIAPLTSPPLTTIRQDPAEQVRRMVRTLHQLQEGTEPTPRHQVLPVTLVERAST